MTTGLVESNGSLLLGDDLKVTCGLTVCTPGSAPGPTLGNEYGRTLVLPNQFTHDNVLEASITVVDSCNN